MPFTPSHVAAVVPLRGVLGLPLAALAAGSMSPDLLYFVPGGAQWSIRPPTHSPAGVVTWDLLLGVGMWAAWRWAAPALHDLAPEWVRQRWRVPAEVPRWWLVVLAVVIGSLTHVGWDSFTHEDRFGPTHLAILADQHPGAFGPLAGYKYAQYVSGLLGLAVAAWVGLRQPCRWVEPRRDPLLARMAPAVVLGAALGAGVVRLTVTTWSGPLRELAFDGITATMGAGCFAVAAICLPHRTRAR